MSLIWLHILFVNREIILIDLSCLGNNDPPPLELISNSLKSKTHVLIIAMKMFVRLMVLFVPYVLVGLLFSFHLNAFSMATINFPVWCQNRRSFSLSRMRLRRCEIFSHMYNVGYVWLKAMSMYIRLHPCSITENRWNMMWRYTKIFSVQSNAEIAVFRFVLEATHLVFTTCVLKQLGILNSERHTNTNMHQMPDSNTYLIWSC